MKPAIALVALLISACTESPAEPSTAPSGPSPIADSCAVARPDFGAVATAADRSLFAYDVNAPLNLQKTVESTNNGVEVSAISFSSPDGGSVTGLLFDPVTRSSLRPGIVLMHGMPGDARVMAAHGQLLAEHGAVVIAIDAPFARRSGPPVRFSTQDRAEQIQLIKDLQRAVDVLRARANVDDGRIAYHGISYGGAMGALFVGIERRIKAAALVVGDGGTDGWTTWYPWPMRRICTQPRRGPRRSAGTARDTDSINRRRSIGWIGCTRRSVSTPGSSAVAV